MINYQDALESISSVREDSIVVTMATAVHVWDVVSKSKELDLPCIGSMGSASSMALGLAIARPDLKVILIDTDGSLLMNLGSLVTIAGQSPKNFFHFVMADGVYFTTGSQILPGFKTNRLEKLAKGAGYPISLEISNKSNLDKQLPLLLENEGPVFVSLKVEHPNNLSNFVGSTHSKMRQLSKQIKIFD